MSQSAEDNQRLSFLKPEESMQGPAQFQAVLNNMLGQKHTVMLAKVIKVKAGGVGAVGTVDIQPLVMMIDAANNVIERGVIHGAPYFRLQGGSSAVIIDPAIGDIGLALFAERDISTVVRTRAAAAPNTKRQFALSDALYLGSYLGLAPSQYMHIKPGGGIDIVSTGEINMNGTQINLNAPVVTSSTVVAASDITDMASGGGKSMASMRDSYNNHDHISSSPGSNTSKPNQQV